MIYHTPLVMPPYMMGWIEQLQPLIHEYHHLTSQNIQNMHIHVALGNH